MTFCPEHPKRDQNPKFTTLRETSILAAFIWESPPGYLFTSKYHQHDFCKNAGCCDVTTNEATKIARQTYKFQHSWLNKRSLSFCVTTEMWWPVYVEGEGLFCLKNDTSNPQNKSKVFNKEPCKRFRPEEFEDPCRYNIWTQFQRRCYRGFPGFREPLTNAKESRKMCVLDHKRRAT